MGTLRVLFGGGIALAVIVNVIAGLAGPSASSFAVKPSSIDNASIATETNSSSIDNNLTSTIAVQMKSHMDDKERARVLAAATKGLKRKRDEMEKVTFYTPAGGDTLKTQVGAYLGLSDGGSPYLRMKNVYYGERWIFFQSVKVLADDEIVLEKVVSRRDITRDNAAGSVWEIADYTPNASEVLALEKISRAKNATIRFSGRDRIFDHNISKAERTALQSVLQAHAKLKASF